ncbi:acyl-CoA dehydrogenase family protein [Pseudonocardia sp. NPDC049154]|uniref:acyl-CoA dehydrogenase family protein n=1 Tax=Pseudonocardia sp. NPDC049154 TaxID=3155501 RepID=UPI0033D20EFA
MAADGDAGGAGPRGLGPDGGGAGLHGLAIPEEFGGSGFGPVEQLVVAEESGRALLVAPFFGSVVLVANALVTAADSAADTAAAKDLLPGLADGSRIAALAVTEDSGSWDLTESTVTAAGDRLSGHKSFVLDGAAADLFLVSARTEQGLGLFAVEATASGLRRKSLVTLDPTRQQVRLTFDAVAARPVGDPGGAAAVLAHTVDLGLALLSAELVGSAQAVLDMSLEYAKTRAQFSRRISFQAVKHRLADMLVAVESGQVAAYEAVRLAVDTPSQLPAAAAMAKAAASKAAVFCAIEAIQLHGGIGFTYEHDAHLYYRRAHSSALLFGDANRQKERLASLLGI